MLDAVVEWVRWLGRPVLPEEFMYNANLRAVSWQWQVVNHFPLFALMGASVAAYWIAEKELRDEPDPPTAAGDRYLVVFSAVGAGGCEAHTS